MPLGASRFVQGVPNVNRKKKKRARGGGNLRVVTQNVSVTKNGKYVSEVMVALLNYSCSHMSLAETTG